jgi:hypothetical protein
MAQRASGYSRAISETYETPAWPVQALLCHLSKPECAWDPCDRGRGLMIDALRRCRVTAIGTAHDFFTISEPPPRVDTIICNPPYGEGRRSEAAVAFIEHALALKVPRIAMLLRNDFDSALTRLHLFRNEPRFEGPSSPSDNHSWFCWSQDNGDAPTLKYISRDEAER